MTDKDDPFGLANDAGRTRIRPVARPRADRPVTPAAPQEAGWPADAGSRAGAGSVSASGSGSVRSLRHPRQHPNPLIAAFAPLLEFAPELERAAPPANAETLRTRLLDNLIDARDVAVANGTGIARADRAAWFVAALLDDLALNTPWGGGSGWPRQPLLVSLYGDVDAGTKFFDRLDTLQARPDSDRELLELAHCCLSLGFRGKYRVEGTQAQGGLAARRAAIARLLRIPGEDRGALSPHWQGVVAKDERRRFAVPLWTIALVAAALMAGVYTLLGTRLSAQAEHLYALARVIPPAERAQIFRPVRETVAPPPEIVLEPVVLELLPEFRANAPTDTAQALNGREDVSLAILSIQGTAPELFRSAKADINDIYGALIDSVATTIVENIEVIGGVTVIGHTDSVPVQRTNPFASNQGLSEARARTIAEHLARAGVPVELLLFEGRAASEPVGDNATPEGRARNRRVEIRIGKKL